MNRRTYRYASEHRAETEDERDYIVYVDPPRRSSYRRRRRGSENPRIETRYPDESQETPSNERRDSFERLPPRRSTEHTDHYTRVDEVKEQAKAQAREESRASVRRTLTNLDKVAGGDARKYFRVKYGIDIRLEKTLDELEDEDRLRASIREAEPNPVFNRRPERARRSAGDRGDTAELADKHESSDSDSDDGNDERAQDLIDAIMGPTNMTDKRPPSR